MYVTNVSSCSLAAEEIVAFLHARGYCVVQGAGCWWYNEYHQARIYYPFPLHRLVAPTPEEVVGVFNRVPKAFALRFLGPLEGKGKLSYIWVCRKPYTLADLSHNIRHNVRRGLKRCQVRAISFDELVECGWQAHQDTVTRHGEKATSLGIDTGLKECGAYEAWGAFVDGNLAAYVVTLWVEDWVHFVVKRSADAYLKFYPNNALVFTVVRELLSHPGVSAVSQGWESLVPDESLDYSKISMGFQKEPVRQRIVLRPWLRALLNRKTCSLIQRAAQLNAKDLRWQRLAGLCRFVAES